MAVDGSGNIWVGDRAYNRIVELSSTGAFLQAMGKLGTAHGQFNHPTHVAVFGSKLYVCDVWNDRVEVFDINGGPVGTEMDTFTGSVDAAGTATKKWTFTVSDTNAPIAASLDWLNAGANLNLFLYKPGSRHGRGAGRLQLQQARDAELLADRDGHLHPQGEGRLRLVQLHAHGYA